jgi:metallopeptidase MepB
MFALDIFQTGFQADTMSKEAGRKYREMVLQVGGSQPEMETLINYLGHKPDARSYFDFIGRGQDS